jgi:Fe2+ or Zn2+ uptake regulation protein
MIMQMNIICINRLENMASIRELKGQRVTSQRKLLLDLLRQSEGHLDAEELYKLAKEREPRISLSTVYRNLSLFKELGLIEEHHFVDEHHYYEVKGSKEHHHLICLGCGKVIEFESKLTDKMQEQVSRETGFEVINTEVNFEGYCNRCRLGRRDERP